MGAWGHGNFDNDDALDWVYAFEQKGVAAIAETFRAASEGDYLEVDVACTALAAGEVLAAVDGRASPQLPEELGAAIERHRGAFTDLAALKAQALEIIGRVTEDSELQELWDETDEAEVWRQAVSELVGRLG